MQLFSAPPRQSYMPLAIPQDVPAYKIMSGGFYVDDELLPEGTFIVYEDTPNLEMEPMNELAFAKMREYLSFLDKLGYEKEKEDKRAYMPLLPAFETKYAPRAASDGRRVAVLNRQEDVPMMGGKRKGRSRVSRIEAVEVDSRSVAREVGNRPSDANGALKAGKVGSV